MTYEEVRAELAQAYGWTFDEIDGMTFEQIGSARSGGAPRKGPSYGSLGEAIEAARDMRANWRKYLGV